MRIYELKRNAAIKKVMSSIKEAEEQGKAIDFKTFAYLISEEFGVSIRTAREYINVAKVKCQLKNEA